jgi:hypothetical protein
MPKDFEATYHGSIVTLAPLTADAIDWVHENLPPDVMWIGGAVAIEPRYLDPIVVGILEAGLSMREDA